MAQPQPPIQLSEDEIDDLLYFARTGETDDFLQTLSELKQRISTAGDEVAVLLAAHDGYSGNNVLHMTAGNGHLELTEKILSLLPAPASPDARPHALLLHANAAGNTPLHWAALNGHLEVVKALVMAANADPTVANAAGHDAVYEAELNDKRDVVEWLLSHCENLEEGVTGKKGEDGEAEAEADEVEGEVEGKGKGKAAADSTPAKG